MRRVLERERGSPDVFVTLCLARFDPTQSQLQLLNLGHPAPVLLGGGASRLQSPIQPPLGAFDLPIEDPVTLELPDDWSLIFYTDGLIEGRMQSAGHERFGEDRPMSTLAALSEQKPDETLLERVVEAVETASGVPFDDDVTVVLITGGASTADATSSTPSVAGSHALP
jgi:serine phosphatase RsbU (regulator of sigma subunit)